MNWRRPIVISGVPRLIIIGLIGGVLGTVVAGRWNLLPLGPRQRVVPALYRTPKIPGGTPLRLAMVHDVLHERYLRHGTAWYQRRNDLAREVIARATANSSATASPEYLDALDDLAVGLENTNQRAEAIAVLRKKLALVSPLPAAAATHPADGQQETAADIDERDLRRILAAQSLPFREHHQYTTCANLGTILVHRAMAKAMAGDAHAVSTVREGLGYIERAIAINPGAHFGRETWQAIAIEHFLAAMNDPGLITEYDLIGDPLDPKKREDGSRSVPRTLPDTPESDLTPGQRLYVRSHINRIGIAPEWVSIVRPDYTRPMPFDEPTLAIIGMWTFGGGANPHFALALGIIMENVGQPSIAWNAYERAVELADKFSPNPAIREKLVTYCHQRQLEQARFEASPRNSSQEAPAETQAWQDQMRHRHQNELAWGLRYQKEYQDYEAAKIAAGSSIADPHFYDTFFAGRPSIASVPGLSDDFIVTYMGARAFVDLLPCMMLGMGLAMALGLMIPERHLSSLIRRD